MIRPRQYALLLAFTILPHLFELDIVVGTVSFLLVAWALYSDHNPEIKPKAWVINTMTLMAPLYTRLKFGSFIGPESATSLLLILISLKMFEVYSRRDAIIILALNLLLGMYHLIFRQDLFTTIYMLVVVFWVFGLLFKLHRPRTASEAPGIQLKSLLSLEALVAVPILLALFFFFPRFSSPFGRLGDPEQNLTGFSEDLRAGDLARLANSEEVAFRVQFLGDESLPTSEMYFRGLTLSATDGINWFKGPRKPAAKAPSYSADTKGIHYRIIHEPRFNRNVFNLEGTYSFQLLGASSQWKLKMDGSIKTEKSNTQKFQLVGALSDSDFSYPYYESRETQLPVNFESTNPRLVELIKEIRKLGPSRNLLMEEVKQRFGQMGLNYTLETPQYESLDQLLFEEKLGFCEHFASAATVMARALEVPARVVVGFHGAEKNQFANYYVVRDKQAHAWMEYLDDSNRWVRMDPTAEVSGYRVSQGLSLIEARARQEQNATLLELAKGAWDFVDSMNNRFALMLLDMNSEQQISWLTKLGFQNPNRRTLWKIFAWVIGGLLAIIGIYFWIRRPKVDQLESARRQLQQKLIDLDIGFKSNLGPIETLSLLEEKAPQETEVQKLVTDYAKLRYSESPDTDLKDIQRQLDRL